MKKFLYIGNDKITGCHSRLCFNETNIIINGVNYSSRYSGTCEKPLPGLNFCWYEHGVLFKHSGLEHTFRLNKNSLFIHKDAELITTNSKQQQIIIDNIKNAKHEIYFENQYYFSSSTITHNNVSKTLIERLNRAIALNENFKFTLIVNYYNNDESPSIVSIMNTFVRFALQDLRESIKCDDVTFKKYVKILIPTDESNMVIHSKVYAFDESKILYTSANIIDRSLQNSGDFECGIYSKNGSSLISQCKKQLPVHLLQELDVNNIIDYPEKIFVNILACANPFNSAHISGTVMN